MAVAVIVNALWDLSAKIEENPRELSQRAVMHSHDTMDGSQITHNSMCVSSIHMQCNLHRHCSHSSYHAS